MHATIFLYNNPQLIMSLSSLSNASRFINTLIKNGYDDTLSSLHDLDINESSDNVFKLLTDHRNTNIDTEHALTICDELCAQYVINSIIDNNCNPSNNLLPYHIINHNLVCYTNAYNRGYTIMLLRDPTLYMHEDINVSAINNAYKNGLHYTSLYVGNNTYNLPSKIDQCVLDNINDIIRIDADGLALLSLCKNVEKINVVPNAHINKFIHIDINNIMSHFVHNVTTLSISSYYVDNFLKRYTRLYELNITDDRVSFDRMQLQFPKSLRILNLSNAPCEIYHSQISECINLKKLLTSGTSRITTCAPFAHNLIMLDAHGTGSKFGNYIYDDGLKLCHRLKILNASNNPNITTCAPFAKTLRVLNASFKCGITDSGLNMCNRLTRLTMNYNMIIRTCAPFAKSLIQLFASHTIIADDGLKLCNRLKILNADCNPNVTTCAPFAESLEILCAAGVCGIDDKGIALCTNLQQLHTSGNDRIRTKIVHGSIKKL